MVNFVSGSQGHVGHVVHFWKILFPGHWVTLVTFVTLVFLLLNFVPGSHLLHRSRELQRSHWTQVNLFWGHRVALVLWVTLFFVVANFVSGSHGHVVHFWKILFPGHRVTLVTLVMLYFFSSEKRTLIIRVTGSHL